MKNIFFENLVILDGSEGSKGKEEALKAFLVICLNNYSMKIAILSCSYTSLKCEKKSETQIEYPSNYLIPTTEGLYINYPQKSRFDLLGYKNLKKISSLKYPMGVKKVGKSQDIWVGITNRNIF